MRHNDIQNDEFEIDICLFGVNVLNILWDRKLLVLRVPSSIWLSKQFGVLACHDVTGHGRVQLLSTASFAISHIAKMPTPWISKRIDRSSALPGKFFDIMDRSSSSLHQ